MAKNSYPLSQVASQLNSILLEMFQEYGNAVSEKAGKVTQKVAEDFAAKLKQATPRSTYNTEHMADTVKVTKVGKKEYGISNHYLYVHYGKWQISHLLEFGWTTKDGKRVDRTPFVRPLFDQNKERYVQMYKEELSSAN